MLPVSALNTIVHNQVVPKKLWRNLALMKLKLKFFSQSPTKSFCINVFNVGGCLLKKRVHFSRKKLVLINLNAIFPFEICCNFSYKNLF